MNEQFMLFLLVLMRMSGFIFLNPILGRRNIPSIVKTGFSMALAVVVYSITSQTVTIESTSAFVFGFLLLKEFFLGYLLGFVMELFLFAVTYSGAIMDFQIGLSMATVYDAQNGTQSALTGTIFNIYYILLFFAVDGHLALMKILIESGQVIPYGMAVVTRGSAQAILTIFSECVVLAVKLALPMIAIQFLVEIAVGILMKIIPQINIFILSIQLKIIIGFIMLFVLISPIGSMFGTIVTQMMNEMIYVLKTATT